MKKTIGLFLVLFAVLRVHGAEVGEDRLKLFTHTRRSNITYEWWLGASLAAAIPKWQPEIRDEPPLSLKKAIAIARKEGQKGEELESVEILSIRGLQFVPAFNSFFYYKLTFRSLMLFDRRVCIVLMDGKVLAPLEVGKESVRMR